MGYYINVKELNVKILKENFPKAHEVFKKLKEEQQTLGTGGSSGDGSYTRHYAFANDFKLNDDLMKMFEAFRYTGKVTDDYLILNEFIGQKLGDDNLFWTRMKPLVTKDSVCLFYGEKLYLDHNDDYPVINFLE